MELLDYIELKREYSLPEVAEMLSVTTRCVRLWIQKGQLSYAYKCGLKSRQKYITGRNIVEAWYGRPLTPEDIGKAEKGVSKRLSLRPMGISRNG